MELENLQSCIRTSIFFFSKFENVYSVSENLLNTNNLRSKHSEI